MNKSAIREYVVPEEISISPPDGGDEIVLKPILGGYGECVVGEILLFVITKRVSEEQTEMRLFRSDTKLEMKFYQAACINLRKQGVAVAPVTVAYNTGSVIKFMFVDAFESVVIDYSGLSGRMMEIQ
ncbi:hypothetical protein DRU65_02735 [Salmonella enterica subsp. enterica]|nr:hypothetical protein [Salmonella enterica subsp. enterica serovar Chester]ECG1252593.1 hypothetical protein [Salmonella enterica subsp. enterica]